MTLETQTIATLKAMQSRLLNLRQPKMTRLCVVFVQPRCHLEQLQLDVGGLFGCRRFSSLDCITFSVAIVWVSSVIHAPFSLPTFPTFSTRTVRYALVRDFDD